MTDRETRYISTQPEDRIGDLLRAAKAANGLLRDHPLAVLFGALREAADHRRIDDARTHSVDAHAMFAVLEGCRLCETNDAVLGRTVSALTTDANHACARRCIDNRTAAVFEHD